MTSSCDEVLVYHRLLHRCTVTIVYVLCNFCKRLQFVMISTFLRFVFSFIDEIRIGKMTKTIRIGIIYIKKKTN